MKDVITALVVATFLLTPSLSKGDLYWGVTDAGILYGSTDVGEGGRGLLVLPDGTRYVFTDRRAFQTYSDNPLLPVCVRWLDWHEECVPFGETDCERGVTNFDIDPFLLSVLGGVPDACGGRLYGVSSVDQFVVELLREPLP